MVHYEQGLKSSEGSEAKMQAPFRSCRPREDAHVAGRRKHDHSQKSRVQRARAALKVMSCIQETLQKIVFGGATFNAASPGHKQMKMVPDRHKSRCGQPNRTGTSGRSELRVVVRKALVGFEVGVASSLSLSRMQSFPGDKVERRTR